MISPVRLLHTAFVLVVLIGASCPAAQDSDGAARALPVVTNQDIFPGLDRIHEAMRAGDGDAAMAALAELLRAGFEPLVEGQSPQEFLRRVECSTRPVRTWGPSGSSAGLLSAMELRDFDLSACDLAVLSACGTNVGVGIERHGQGVQFLQTALHMAGARTSVTSLWNVDDAATRELMTRFYENLWANGMGSADPLWEAKKTLRGAGHPPAHWAGWVLAGDPD
ncbi:MAG: CHAT domain-containing protein [Planctomycetota bacterium]|nr:CHAT domain-containing protein [Planctomycetota bacterium]